MRTDIEIAQSAAMLPISQVAAAAGIDEDLLEHYGKVKAKITVAADADEEAAKVAAQQAISNALEGKTVRKVIYVAGRLVNIVAN